MGPGGVQGLPVRASPLAIAFSGGILVCTTLPTHPGPWVAWGAVVLAGGLLFVQRRLSITASFLLAIGLALASFQSQLDDRLDPGLSGEIRTLEGTVASTPAVLGNSTRFRFEPSREQGDDRQAEAGPETLPETLLVRWYRDAPDIHAGERWLLEVRLRPPWGSVNFSGPDKERWLFAERIGGLATVRQGRRLEAAGNRRNRVLELRTAVRDAIARNVADPRQAGVIQALATADRSGISREDGHLLRVTGTAHLLAISGLHIGLSAVGGLLLGRAVLFLFPLGRLGRLPTYLPHACAVITGSAYAVLAGLGVSTLRALLMLLALVLALCSARGIHPLRSFVLALALVLLFNPMAPLGAGFWFSFLAVLALFAVFQPRHGDVSWWKAPLLAQAAIFLVLLPASAAWYSGLSLVGFPSNLFAIPWVSFLVVPPVLLGILALPASETAAAALWALAGLSVSMFLVFLEWVGRAQPWLYGVRSLSLPLLLCVTAGALLLLLPRGLPGRWLGLFLVLPQFLPAAHQAAENGFRVDALDVGQGTAITVSTKRHLLLYDTGPGDGNGIDQVASAIAPLLPNLGRREPDRLVISHGDLDHRGGLFSFRRRYPGTPVIGSLREHDGAVEACRDNAGWDWDGFAFRVLHPSPGLPYLSNNSSCVLSVRNSATGILLAGDIEDFVEQRLLAGNLGKHSLLLAPHHGSASSSSPAFIRRVQPQAAVATASLGNRFGFPREKVRRRYEAEGVALWATGECGGLRIVFDERGHMTAKSARRERRRIWRYPAAGNCP